MASRRPWRKLLWVRQEYPDNWVDPTFLNKLQRNANVVAYDYWPLVADSTVLTQHLCSVVVFISSFVGIYQGTASPLAVAAVSTVATASAYAFWSYYNDYGSITRARLPSSRPRRETAKSALLIVLTILGLSPILNSLTQSSDSDSIWTIALYLFAANIAFHDYSMSRAGKGREQDTRQSSTDKLHEQTQPIIETSISYSGNISTNAAVMGSVVLASRLGESSAVFGLTLFAVEWFALFPIFRRFIRGFDWGAHMSLTASLVLLANAALAAFITPSYAAFFDAVLFFISFVCPLWLIQLQRYKNEISGPWDIAKPVIKSQ